MNTPKGMVVDHIDGNGLNNQRENLRVVTYRQNCQNRHTPKTSIYPGVSWCKYKKRWFASIKINGKNRKLGRYNLEIDAYNAYTDALKSIGETVIGS